MRYTINMIGSGGGVLPGLLLVVATVAGSQVVACGGGGGGGGAGSGTEVPLTSAAAVAITELWRRLAGDSRLVRHRRWFALRRAEKAAAEHADWASEQGQLTIIARVQQELDAVEAYATKKLGTPDAPGSIFTGASDPTPHHLDLDDVAKIRTDSKAAQIKKTAAEYRELRRQRGLTIIWRAAAIEPLVWRPAPAVALDEPVLDHLLDRRLHAVERMELNVNAGGDHRTWVIDGNTGPWRDGNRVRMFEYGMLPAKPFDVVMPFGEFEKHGDVWINWDTYVPPAIAAQLPLDSSSKTTYWIFYKAGTKKPHEVFTRLFTPSTDFLKRAWFYCDIVISSIMVESLQFGLERKTGDHAEFDKLFDEPMYVYLGPHVGRATSNNVLMDDEPKDVYFDNSAQLPEVIQVGDEMIIWNHRLYDYMGRGAWRNEYSLVMDIDSDPRTSVDTTSGLLLAGHGLNTKTAPAIADELAKIFGDQLDGARAAIKSALQADPTVTSVAYQKVTLVRWDPYNELGGPWWVKIDKPIWGPAGFGLATMQEALRGFARAIAAESPAPAGYTAPPGDADTIYFPLSEPMYADNGYMSDPWLRYLASRAGGARGAVKLRDLLVDGRLTPGLFYRSKQEIPMVRPQAK